MENKIHPCFKLLKTFKDGKVNKIISILNQQVKSSDFFLKCFTTDYGLIIYDKNDNVIQDVTMSLPCNKFLFHDDEYAHVFREADKKKLIRLLKLKHSPH